MTKPRALTRRACLPLFAFWEACTMRRLQRLVCVLDDAPIADLIRWIDDRGAEYDAWLKQNMLSALAAKRVKRADGQAIARSTLEAWRQRRDRLMTS